MATLPSCPEGGTFIGHHIGVPKRGVAVHINAYNFPIWGMLEKVSVNLLAGVPALVKPATLTSYVAHAMVKEIVASGILPEGALQLVCGGARDILDHVGFQDVVTFTGSAATGLKLKSHPRILAENVPFNLEADSLNSLVLGPDAEPGTPEFDLFVKELRREMTIKCGQRCTAVRRAMVPEGRLEAVRDALKAAVGPRPHGRPRVGRSAHGSPRRTWSSGKKFRQAVARLEQEAETLLSADSPELMGADWETGAFYAPRLLTHHAPLTAELVHEVEPFGPVACLLPYRDLDDAICLDPKGKGVPLLQYRDRRVSRWPKCLWSRRPPTMEGSSCSMPNVPRRAQATAAQCRSWCTVAQAALEAAKKWADSEVWGIIYSGLPFRGTRT